MAVTGTGYARDRRKTWVGLFALILGLASLAACNQDPESLGEPGYSTETAEPAKEYVFAIHPLHNPVKLFEIYGPLIDWLNRQIPQAVFRLEASRNYEEFEKKLYGRQVDFAMPNPYQTVQAMRHGYYVIAKMGDDAKFKGILLVRRDSGIVNVSDLKGKKVAYPARTALAAALLPQYFLQTHGVDVRRDIENVYVGSQESVIMNVFLGDATAGATWPLPWESFQQEHPDMARELTVQWETEALVNNSIMARDDVPPELVSAVAQSLATLHETEQGRQILSRMPVSAFELADDSRYLAVKTFLAKFHRQVYPLE